MKQELFNFLDSKKIPEITSEKLKIEDFKVYFKEFFQKNPQTDIRIISNLSDKEIMTPLMILCNPLKTKEILDVLDKYPDLFKDNQCTEMLAELIIYYSNKQYQELIEICQSLNPFIYIPAAIQAGQLLLDNGLNPNKADAVNFFNKYPMAKKELEVLFINLSAQYHNVATYFMDDRDYYIYNSDYESISETEFLTQLPRELKRKYKKAFGTIKNCEDKFREAIKKYFNFINVKYEEIIKDYERRERERRTFNKNIEELKNLLTSNGEIRNIEDILKLCPTSEIKESVLNYVIDHNKKVYLELIKQYEKAQQNSDENLTILFNTYGFNYLALNQEDRSKIKEISYIDIEGLLKRLNTIGLNTINVSKVSLYKLSTIEELIFKGIITKNWLQDNNDLLYEDNNDLDQVITNIDMLSKEGINMLQYSNSLDITRSNYLKHNLYLLRLYSLAITKTTTDLNFLAVSDLRLRIEFMYSLGIHTELTNLNILNSTIEYMLKLKIANSLNIPIDNISDLSELFCDFAPYIIPEDIKRKLEQDSDFITSIPMFLEQFRIDSQTLNINGIYVSSEKVKRNLVKTGNNSRECCFYAIIYNGYYTYEELEVLKSVLIPEQTLLNGVRS